MSVRVPKVSQGRFLVVQESGAPESKPIWDEIISYGYEVIKLPLDGTAQAVRRGLRPDAVILDMIAAEMVGAEQRYRAAAGRLLQLPERRLPVLSLGMSATDSMPIGVAEIRGGRSSIAALQIIRRVNALTRMATMNAEHQRRLRTAASFRVSFPDIGAPFIEADADILVVGASRRYLAIETQLSKSAIVTATSSPQTAFDYLERRSFDAVIVDLDDAAAFVTDLRNHPKHFEVPVVVVAEATSAIGLVEAGATEIVDHQDIDQFLAKSVRGLVSEYRFRRALKSVYSRGRHLETNDSLTGLYTRGFLMAHLDHAREDAQTSGEPFAICGFRLPLLENINTEQGYAAGDRVLRQIGLMLGRLSRAEDLAARYGANFVLLMPGTTAERAATPIRRIAGIVRSTDLMLPEGGAARIDLDSRVLTIDPDEPTARLMHRLFD